MVGAIERKRKGLSKGDFESTKEFETRKKLAFAGEIFNGARIEDKFAVVFPILSYLDYPNGFSYKYDADTKQVLVSVKPEYKRINGFGPSHQHSMTSDPDATFQFRLDRRLSRKRDYVGVNGFGAKINVEEIGWSVLGVVSAPQDWYEPDGTETYRSGQIGKVEIDMGPSQAASEIPKLKVLMVVQMTPPFIAYDSEHIAPTRDFPKDITTYSSYLHVRILGMVFYSGITGEIFARLPSDFGVASME